MAQAVMALFPEAKFGIGPSIEDGFYYDFELPRPLVPEDLPQIEEIMTGIVKDNLPFIRSEVTKAEARETFASQPYKLELIEDLPDDEPLSIYQQGTFTDLCRGPHLDATGEIKAFKLLNTAGAYWRGDERRPMLQRIYGTAFETEAELQDYLEKLEAIEARDHRRLTKQLDLISFHEEAGAGLAYWHPKGGRMRVLIEDYWRELHFDGGYDIVFTPHIGKAQLWETSGHLDFYKDGMYSPMDIDGHDYYVKPMNCPFHIMIYKTKLRSYRELPLRWAELGTVYRYERSGTLHGLLRVRGFTQDDAHIVCAPEQIEDEILRVLDFSLNMLQGFGFEDFKVELSVRDPQKPDKYAGSGTMWDQAEVSLIKALQARDLPYERMEGEAVFYGPKIDIKIKDALGRSWQCSTIQFDFNVPERFDMTYVGEDGRDHRPYMVHRALLGSLERFYGVLVEHYAGAFPVWLAPVQAIVIPIADRHLDYAYAIAADIKARGIRIEVDDRSERMNLKVREAQLQKIPYMLIVGDSEVSTSTLSVRLRNGDNLKAQTIDDFQGLVASAIEERT
jgi:threonyl-tRNA synthetase